MILTVMLVLTGLGLGQSFDTPEPGQGPITDSAASILPVTHIPHSDLLYQEEQHNVIQPVQRAKTASRLQMLHSGDSVSAAAVAPLTAVSFCPIWYSTDWAAFTAPSWRSIVSLIHRTRRKSH